MLSILNLLNKVQNIRHVGATAPAVTMKFNHQAEKDGEVGPAEENKFSFFTVSVSDVSKYKVETADFPIKTLKLEAFLVYKKDLQKKPEPQSAIVVVDQLDAAAFKKTDAAGTFTIPLKNLESYKALNAVMKKPEFVYFRLSGLPLKKEGDGEAAVSSEKVYHLAKDSKDKLELKESDPADFDLSSLPAAAGATGTPATEGNFFQRNKVLCSVVVISAVVAGALGFGYWYSTKSSD